MGFPRILRIRQHFDRPRVEDIAVTVTAQLERLDLGRRIRPGQSVALTAGSRGIANIPLVLKATADFLKRLGAKPFLIPAMGSHGGGIAENQQKIIESYGITEAFVGVPIRASMETIVVGTTSQGYPVYLDRHASEGDHIAVIGRIKPHTGFHGPVESGLLKMMMIGLGKHTGALFSHRILLENPYDEVVRAVGRTMIGTGRIAFGLGIVENAYDETALIEAVAPEQFERREEALLVQARDMLPRLPLRKADLLIVDRIGKDISGSGVDTNVVGRKRAFRDAPTPPDIPVMRYIFIRGLTPNTHGNASGIGLGDFTRTDLVKSMNYRATVINCLTAGYPDGAFLPVHFETDREVLEAALALLGSRPAEEARIIRIRDTLHLEEVEISEPVLDEKDPQTTFTPISQTLPLQFDAAGDLLPL